MFKKFKERWVVLLLALPFAGVGVGLMAFSVIPSVNEWQEMKTWPQAEAQLESAELRISRGDDSTTYEAIARYTYRYQMQDYSSDRVAIMSGSDNVGNFQQDLASELQSAWRDQQPVPVWINPADPKDAVLNRDMRWNMLTFKLVFALVFGGVGIGLTAFILLVNIDTKNHPQSDDKPWLSRREWASDEVSCNTKNALWFIWCFAIIWSLLSLPAALAIPEELASGNNLSLVALLFPLVGIFLFIWAIRSTLSWRRFGQLTLKLDPYPGSIGGQVGGTIELPIVYDSQQSFTTNLFCIRSYETGTDKNRSRSEAVLWQGQGLAHSQPSTGGTRLSICFDVPKDLPESEPASTNYRFWRLELKADLPGVDLQRQFEIPVFATGEKSRAALPLSDQHPQLGAEHEAQIEAVADIEQIPGGVRLYFPMLRSWGGKLIGLVCGVIFVGAAVFMYNETDAPITLVGMFIVIGGGITLTSLKLLFTSLRVQLDHNGLISQRYWLGIPIGRDQIPRADITTLQIATSYKTQSTQGHVEYCKINAVTRSGKKIRIAMNLKGRATAQAALEAIGSLSGYAIH